MAVPESLLASVYEDLRRLAAHWCMRWLRLDCQAGENWRNRAQFIAVAAEMLRRVLVDHARARLRVSPAKGA